MSPWKVRGVSGYLGPAASVHIGADGVVSARPTYVQVGAVPRLDQADEVATLPLQENRETQPHRREEQRLLK